MANSEKDTASPPSAPSKDGRDGPPASPRGGPPPPSQEEESRRVAEAAREAKWEKQSFARGFFEGSFRLDLVDPPPEQDPDEAERGREFLENLEAFVRDNLDGNEVDRQGHVPEEILDGLRELGAFGIKIPREYGGLGLSQLTYNRALGLVASRCASTGAFLSAHQSIGVPQPLVRFGTEEQKRKYLPRIASGALTAFALTEPEVGSDPARMKTTATPTEDGEAYVLNGEKLWTTNGPRADLMVVMARTPSADGDGSGRADISAFVVESEWEGVEVAHECEFMGLRGISNGVIRFSDVRVPRENLLWGEGQGLKLALITLNTGRLSLPAFCAAAAKGSLELSRDWASRRVQWGAPVGKHDAVAQMLGRMAATSFAMEAGMELSAAMADDEGLDIRLEAAMAKLWHSEASWEVINHAVQIRGGRGYETYDSLRDRGEEPVALERSLRDLRINTIFEGSSEIMRLFIAREAVDSHLRVAGDLVEPDRSLGERFRALLGAGLHYSWWYPSRWVGWGHWPRYQEFGALAGHVRFLDRASRKLARTLFHSMARHGARLEKRQAVLGRMVDIGCDLFLMTSAVVRAKQMLEKDPDDRGPEELADLFCRHARRRIRTRFREVTDNDDEATYRVARRAMDGAYAWLEKGVVPQIPEERKRSQAPVEEPDEGIMLEEETQAPGQ